MINRDAFFGSVREAVFHGMSQSQVDGCNAILDEVERRSLADMRLAAYILATAWWESDHTMQPIREEGEGRGHSYGIRDPHTGQTYYGRGLVQITWKTLYQKFATLLKIDLVNHPDLALEMPTAISIMFEGMLEGLFTGRKLGDFIHGNVNDTHDARRVVNGLDQASTIAGSAKHFLTGLSAVA